MDKVCGICGENCSDRPRVKDRAGRYYCTTCAMERARARQAPPPAQPDDLDPYHLDVDPGARPLPVEMLDHVEPSTPCPACMRSMAPGAKVCVACGYHVEKGIQSSTRIERTKTKGGRRYQCRECGYDLTGLRSGVCPECGNRVSIGNKQRDWDAQIERDVIVNEWRKPAIVAGIGALAVCGILAGQGAIELLPYYGLFLGAEVVLGFIILWCSFAFLGDIGTPLLNLLRLTALYLVVDSLWLLVVNVPSFWIRNGVTGLAYIGLFTNFFDVHWEDAWIVMIVNWLVKMAIVITVVLVYPQFF